MGPVIALCYFQACKAAVLCLMLVGLCEQAASAYKQLVAGSVAFVANDDILEVQCKEGTAGNVVPLVML